MPPHSSLCLECHTEAEGTKEKISFFSSVLHAMAASPSPQPMESSSDANATVYGWLSPRISFSTDFGGIGVVAARDSPRREQALELEWSSEFEFSLSIECFSGSSPADDLFFEGKLLPLELLPPPPSTPSPPILLVKDLLNEAPSPLVVKPGSSLVPSGSSPAAVLPVPGTSSSSSSWREFFGRNSKNSSSSSGDKGGGESKYIFHTLKVVTLFFRRQLGRTPSPPPPPPGSPVPLELVSGGNSAQCEQHDGTMTRSSSSSSSSGNSGRSSKPAAKPASPGSRVLWMNLDRCARRNEQRRKVKGYGKHGDQHGSSSSPGSFSRVAPVLNVPMCMGPVRETKSTLAGLRKLFQGKRSGLQRVTWSCPGGAV